MAGLLIDADVTDPTNDEANDHRNHAQLDVDVIQHVLGVEAMSALPLMASSSASVAVALRTFSPAARRRAGYGGESVLWQRARDLGLKLR
jgi:hypothetical protein